MIKTVPTLGRIAVMAIFALSSFGACLYLWMAFGGPSPLKPKAYQLHVAFPEATQLANQSDVRISGVSVGKVTKLAPGATGPPGHVRAGVRGHDRARPGAVRPGRAGRHGLGGDARGRRAGPAHPVG